MNPLMPLALALPLLAAAPSSLDAMRWHHRVLLVAAPVAGDHALLEQRRLLARWRRGAADRDVVLVEIAGDRVTGARDPAAALRRRFHLRPNAFAALLIGKDGHVAMREDRPIAPDTLERTIDAMPMRRAGGR